MATAIALIRGHPVPAYFALTFAISWGGVLVVLGPGGIPGTAEEFQRLLPIAVLAMIAGPAIAGLVLTGLVHGRPGYREFLSRLLAWRVGARWYALALLGAPLLTMALLLALSLGSREYFPHILTAGARPSDLLLSIAISLGAGIFEEVGWTGFAIPVLRRRRGILATGVIVGALWAAWHWLVGFWYSGVSTEASSLVNILVDPLLYLATFRVLMVWVYDRTRSLLVAMLMHLSLTASARILSGPTLQAGGSLMSFDLAWAAVVCVAIAAVVAGHVGAAHPGNGRRKRGLAARAS